MHLIAPVGIIDFNQQRLFGEVRQSRGTLDNKTQEVSLAAREHRREIVNHSETLLSFQIEREKCVKGDKFSDGAALNRFSGTGALSSVFQARRAMLEPIHTSSRPIRTSYFFTRCIPWPGI